MPNIFISDEEENSFTTATNGKKSKGKSSEKTSNSKPFSKESISKQLDSAAAATKVMER